MPGAQCTRSRACSVESTRVSHHGYAEITRHSRTRMVLTVSFVLSPAPGSFATVTGSASCRLDAGVEASGPHDFAVRLSAVRQERIRVHRIPPRVDDVAQRPSFGVGRREL